MDSDLENLAYAQWLEPTNTRSRKAPIERLHFVKRSMTRKAIMHPDRRVNMQCMQGQDGKFYYIQLDAYNTDHLQIISEVSPLLVNPRPAQFEPGAMYTYIIASIISKDPVTHMDIQVVPSKLYATKAMNMFEFGTKHHQIFYRMSSTDELESVARTTGINIDNLQYGLHASGEIHCITPTSLQFNFYSGTYKMKRAIPKRREKYEMGLITRLMQTIDQTYTPNFKFTPFIVQEALPITQDQIEHLKRKDIPVYGFDTVSQCRTMRINVMRHKNVQKSDMSRAQMDETYKTIVAPAPKAPTPKAATPKAPTPKAATPKASSAPAPVVKALSAASMSRQMPLYAMSGTELRELATSMSLPVQLDHDRATIIKMIQQSTTTGKGGKKR
jgi:hypothetical protein